MRRMDTFSQQPSPSVYVRSLSCTANGRPSSAWCVLQNFVKSSIATDPSPLFLVNSIRALLGEVK
jgi:hypothetical protein